MRIIVISAPDFLPGEAEAVTALLEAGAWRVHVRSIARLLEHIPAALYSRISLHDHHELAARFGVGGVHLNSRNPSVPDGFGGMVSRSCHSIAELSQYSSVCDYMFLSPIFDSISKSGYVSRFSLEEIRRRIAACSAGTAGPMAGMSSDGELSGRDQGNGDCRPVDWGSSPWAEYALTISGCSRRPASEVLLSSAVSGSRSDWTITVLHCPNGSGT